MGKQVRAVSDSVDDAVFLRPDMPASAMPTGPDERMEAMARSAGFQYYLLAAFPRGDRASFSANCLASNWPDELLSFYDGADLFYYCKLVNRIRRSIVPVFCDQAPFEATAANQENPALTALFRQRGLRSTFAFSLHDAELRQYIFAFSGERPKIGREEAMAMVFQSIEFLELFAKDHPTEQPPESLSSREIECLRWSAAGKSSDEIAIILNLSPHTVVGYLKSAMRKLDSVNRMQAIARAFRYRLL